MITHPAFDCAARTPSPQNGNRCRVGSFSDDLSEADATETFFTNTVNIVKKTSVRRHE